MMSEKRHGAWLPLFESEIENQSEGIIGCDAVRGYKCSVCDEPTRVMENGEHLIADYCPDCGAKMDAKVLRGEIVQDEYITR